MSRAAAPSPQNSVTHNDLANAIRALSMDAVQAANSGHPGMPMGMADVATVLFTQFLKFDSKHPNWPDRDRFILSAGHGSMLQYALLYLTGYEDMTLEEVKNFRQWGAKTAGHPEFGHATGIETTTGPLGQGLANAVGMALAERMLAAKYGDALVSHYTYAIAGDGCLMEGISQEAITLAGHLKLGKLIVLFDDNSICIDGPTNLTISEDTRKRFEAAGWDTQAVDGHDPKAVAAAIAKAQNTHTPSLIACKTTIGYGAPTKAGTASTHGSPLGEEEIKGTREKLGWAHKAFEVPADILQAWREAGAKGGQDYVAWSQRFQAADSTQRDDFERRISGELAADWHDAIDAFKQKEAEAKTKEATRQSSGRVLEVLFEKMPELVGGSADLTGSNLTKAKAMKPITAQDFSGNYIYWGVREHAMAAAMNGLALHGGFIPYGGTFLVFTDYCRPAIRLSALMQQRVIYVMTHDSIGLGEDGPTHQPVEHLAALRAMPNVNVFRPADATETAECWALALASTTTPSILALSRQGVPALRTAYTKENLCARGAYVLREALTPTLSQREREVVTLIATGTEVSIAIEAQAKLAEKGIAAKVVSMPCWELFAKQPKAYQQDVLGNGLRVAIEAGIGFGWERWLGENGLFIGMEGFGASAPAPELYKQFGITAEAVVKVVEKSL
jgi:transketolase